MLTALEEDNEISLIGFGRFYKTHTEARTGRNPKTGESIKIAAYYQPRFTAGIKLKEACNKKEKSKKPKKYFRRCYKSNNTYYVRIIVKS